MGHGDANALAGAYLKAGEQGAGPAGEASPDDVLDAIYTGPKADLRPIHEELMAAFAALGPFEVAPKKGYVSLRRKKQFATVGPTTRTRVDVGLNMKGVPATGRLIELPAGGMCQYRVSLTEAGRGRPGAHGLGLAGLRERGVRARRRGAVDKAQRHEEHCGEGP